MPPARNSSSATRFLAQARAQGSTRLRSANPPRCEAGQGGRSGVPLCSGWGLSVSLPRAVCWAWRRAATAARSAGAADEGCAGSCGVVAREWALDQPPGRMRNPSCGPLLLQALLTEEAPEVLAAGGEECLPRLGRAGEAACSSVGGAKLRRVQGRIRHLLVCVGQRGAASGLSSGQLECSSTLPGTDHQFY